MWLTARDMSQSFSNVALQLSIDAVGLLVDAVHIVNCAPASQQGISRATRLMMDASTACMECLSGADTSNTPHLVATREHSMGQTLIENMTVMTRVIADTTQMVSRCAPWTERSVSTTEFSLRSSRHESRWCPCVFAPLSTCIVR